MTEPISLSELKKHLRLSEYVEIPAEVVPSVTIAEHAIGAVTGSAVSVLYERASVIVTPGSITTESEITIKIQDSYAELTGYTDWYPFPVQDDTWTDILTKEYTGQKSYIRVIATVAGASAVFGASVNIMDAENAEDEYLTDLIQAAREYLESRTRRALITRTETYAIHDFPGDDEFIEIPFGNLQSVDSIAYTDDEGYYRKITQEIIATREDFTRKLLGLGWDLLPSKSNFVLAGKKSVPGKEIYLALKARGILVRHFDLPRTKDFVRITIGRREDMEKLLEVIRELF